jgi:hypothetical protein
VIQVYSYKICGKNNRDENTDCQQKKYGFSTRTQIHTDIVIFFGIFDKMPFGNILK